MPPRKQILMRWETGSSKTAPGFAKLRFLADNKRVVFSAVFDKEAWKMIDMEMRGQIERWDKPLQ